MYVTRENARPELAMLVASFLWAHFLALHLRFEDGSKILLRNFKLVT
jgi:hypothetical protein